MTNQLLLPNGPRKLPNLAK